MLDLIVLGGILDYCKPLKSRGRDQSWENSALMAMVQAPRGRHGRLSRWSRVNAWNVGQDDAQLGGKFASSPRVSRVDNFNLRRSVFDTHSDSSLSISSMCTSSSYVARRMLVRTSIELTFLLRRQHCLGRPPRLALVDGSMIDSIVCRRGEEGRASQSHLHCNGEVTDSTAFISQT